MMDSEDSWIYYHDEVQKTAKNVCSDLGFTLGQTWESYLTELSKFPWTTIYLTPLELEYCDQNVKNRVLYALYLVPTA